VRGLAVLSNLSFPYRPSCPLAEGATDDENGGGVRLSSFFLGAKEPVLQTDARGLPGTTNCCPVHVS
jgi:hypothetical protein